MDKVRKSSKEVITKESRPGKALRTSLQSPWHRLGSSRTHPTCTCRRGSILGSGESDIWEMLSSNKSWEYFLSCAAYLSKNVLLNGCSWSSPGKGRCHRNRTGIVQLQCWKESESENYESKITKKTWKKHEQRQSAKTVQDRGCKAMKGFVKNNGSRDSQGSLAFKFETMTTVI